jgi:hypothetical protein
MSKTKNAEARAEARRRSRIAAKERAESGDTEPAAQAQLSPQPQVRKVGSPGVGFRAAFRGSFGAVPIRSDLALLPKLLRTRAFFIPIVLLAITVIVSLQQGALSSEAVQLAVQSILLPPAFVVAFLGGMLTRRGSWLLGGLLGILSYCGALVVGSAGDLTVFQPGHPVGDFLKKNVSHLSDTSILIGDFYGVAVSGMLAGAFAGWYGRFLRAMSPVRSDGGDRRGVSSAKRKGGGRR